MDVLRHTVASQQCKANVHKSNKEITTHRRWKKAFLVFISAHTRKFPEELPGLLIHMNAVNKLAWEQRDWLAYDTDFRTLVTNSAAHYGQLDLQVLVWNTDPTFPTPKNRGTVNNRDRHKGSRTHRPGFCYTCSDGRHCKGYNYKHACSVCNGPDPATSGNSRSKRWGEPRRTTSKNSDLVGGIGQVP